MPCGFRKNKKNNMDSDGIVSANDCVFFGRTLCMCETRHLLDVNRGHCFCVESRFKQNKVVPRKEVMQQPQVIYALIANVSVHSRFGSGLKDRWNIMCCIRDVMRATKESFVSCGCERT